MDVTLYVSLLNKYVHMIFFFVKVDKHNSYLLESSI